MTGPGELEGMLAGDATTGATPSEVACPRCGRDDPGRRFYGPCASCRDELGVTMGRARREAVAEAYVPKLNVVPNHVATKE